MNKEAILANIESMLPEGQDDINSELFASSDMVDAEASDIVRRATAKELARIRAAEKRRLDAERKREAEGIPAYRTRNVHSYMQEQERRVNAVEALQKEFDERDTSNLVPDLIKSVSAQQVPTKKVSRTPTPEELAALQTTTRHDVTKLLASIGINLNMQLTKTDTRNIVACLLTCNEAQLAALMRDNKVPVVIKTIIKRLLDDMACGRMDTIESLWERIFGTKTLTDTIQQGPAIDAQGQALNPTQIAQTGNIPSTPISREAYIILRDTLIK